jgi:predicted Zn-dependent peptidase
MQIKKTILKNGLRVITVPMKDSPAVTVLVMVEAGSKYETRNISGLSHFLEHMCFKGTQRRPKAIDISRELDSIGAQYNAFTSHEFTGYYAKSDARHTDIILDVVSDMYLNPVFDVKEIEKEKGVIIEEINMYEDMPYRKVSNLFMNLLYGDQPAGWAIAGTKETVMAMKREDFVDYRGKHYVSGATTIVVAGKFDEKGMLADIEKRFEGVHEGEKHGKTKVLEEQKKPQILAHYKKTDQMHLVVGVRSCDIFSEHIPALKVMGSVLGGGMSSRLFQKLREEMGVGYYVSADNDNYTDHGLFEVAAGIDNARLIEVVKAILAELKKIKDVPIPEDELKKAKDYLTGSMYLGLESSDSVAEFCGYQEILKKEVISPDELAARLNEVTVDDIRAVAEKIFQNKNLNIALVGPVKDTTELEEVLTF